MDLWPARQNENSDDDFTRLLYNSIWKKSRKINKTTNKKSEDKKLSETYIFYHYYPSLEACSFHNKSIISGLHLVHMQDLKP